MDINELMNAMRTVIACYDALQPSSPIMREVVMWREKFLKDYPQPEVPEKGIYCCETFLSKNCFEMVTKTPEKLYQEIADGYVKKEKDETESPRDA